MGLIYQDVVNLLQAREGLRGGRAVTLGRLDVYIHPGELARLRRRVEPNPQAVDWIDRYVWGMSAEGVFTAVLGFDRLDSLDVSAYEGATIIHDLGEPLPDPHAGQYDLVVDGGTLEHVFNLPQAILNVMALARPGGLVYWHGPSNNLCGHGFYQFSPELMYRVFSAPNGFEPIFIRLMTSRRVSIETSPHHEIYDVMDPVDARQRVNLLTSHPVSILVLARRTSAETPKRLKVFQSDYATTWEGNATAEIGPAQALARRVLPRPWRDAIRDALDRRKASLGYRRFFSRVR